jgi:hypothetical protein
MNRAHVLLIFFVLAAAAAALLVADGGAGAGAPRRPGWGTRGQATGRPPADADRAPQATGPGAAHPDADRAPAPSPATRPRAIRQGVRGAVASPRVTLADGERGVDPAAWECSVYALVPNAARHAVDRIGIARERAPLSRRGDFEVDLPTGSHLVLVQHRVTRPGAAAVQEAWYAYADVGEADVALLDLGRHAFAATTIEGIVTGPGGEPRGGLRVDLSDEQRTPGDPLATGVPLLGATDDAGRFAFSLARADGGDVIASVSAQEGSATARRDGVRPGDFVELVLRPPEPEAEVAFEVPWSPATKLWVYATGRRLGFMRELGRDAPGSVVEEKRRLPPGSYVVELFRSSAACGDEWARVDVAIPDAAPRRIRVDPAFAPARSITGRARPGAKVAWIVRFDDGSRLERDSVIADHDGDFVLRGLPTSQTLLATGSILITVPPGCEATTDVGELESG